MMRRDDVEAALSMCKGGCVRIYVAGDKSHVGKTTFCLSLLGYLRREVQMAASELAYIKPATQCEAADLLSRYCAAEGIRYVSGSDAPLVFYSGFTRAVIGGQVEASMSKVRESVDATCRAPARVCVIDGVGFPGVGSCVGASNADVARAVGAPVVLVSKSGVGGAIDAHALNAALFEKSGVPVLGGVFNMAPRDGFYAKDQVLPVIASFFRQHRPRESVYGVVPVVEDLVDLREKVDDLDPSRVALLAAANVDHVSAHVDLAQLIIDAALDPFNRKRHLEDDGSASTFPPPTRLATKLESDDRRSGRDQVRLAVEAEARRLGAKAGG